ncbi:MAG TPA: radical SAM protein [Mycobacteriales bacterium]|jgi:uncharacterized protein|nr:radical SAM protein [Mycobacteriales bacterium]
MNVVTPGGRDPLSVILKLVGETCNINCYYCFEKRKPYESAERLTPELLRTFLSRCGDRPLAVELHGGEPLLLGKEAMRGILRELGRYPGRVQVRMQTNGTLLDDEWLDLLDGSEGCRVEIGISLDGDRDANAFRVDYADRGTGDRVERALRLMGERGRRTGVIAVVTKRSLGRAAELLDHFASFDAVEAVNLAPCFDLAVIPKRLPPGNRASLLALNPAGAAMPGWAVTPAEYATFVCEAYDHWREAGLYTKFIVDPLFSIIRKLGGHEPSSCHFTEMKCAYVLTLYPDGRLGSCDELPMPTALHGNVETVDLDAALALQTARALESGMARLLARCSDCAYQSSCGGGCIATRLRYENTPLEEQYCAYRMTVIDHVAASLPCPA